LKTFKLKLFVVIFLLGIPGILSLLLMPIPSQIPPEVLEQVSENTLRLLMLINPTLLLLLGTLSGVFLHEKTKLGHPLIEKILKNSPKHNLSSIILYGILAGILAGILLSISYLIFKPYFSEQMIQQSESYPMHPLIRFLYGGITEEIITRYGLMTFFVWVISKINKSFSPPVYWTGIVLAAIVFGAMHLPIALQLSGELTNSLIAYVLIGNSVGGIIFGWLYWKKGLEAAFIGHIFAHVSLLLLALI
jgi:membrane protease YdiL (CAAX protease family)